MSNAPPIVMHDVNTSGWRSAIVNAWYAPKLQPVTPNVALPDHRLRRTHDSWSR